MHLRNLFLLFLPRQKRIVNTKVWHFVLRKFLCGFDTLPLLIGQINIGGNADLVEHWFSCDPYVQMIMTNHLENALENGVISHRQLTVLSCF